MNQPKLELDENHRYTLDDKKMDGLTSTIGEAGLISGYGSDWYKQRGSFVHTATEYWDKGELDESTVDPQIKGYLESWKQFRKDQNYTPTHIEYQIYHPELMVGMKIDRLPGPIDLKAGVHEHWHILQIAVHWATLMCHGMYDLAKSPQDVYLDPDGGPPKVKPYKTSEMRDAFKVYASMLIYLRWRREKYGNGSNS